MRQVPGLLVSVRSVAEAAAALEGGAALIDVKEPSRGSLGRADASTLDAIVRFVAKRRPVSAALGELTEQSPLPEQELAFVKWGLAGCGRLDWRTILTERMASLSPGTRPVVVGYADWGPAGAPPLEEVAAFAQQRPDAAFLIDTYSKGVDSQGRRRTLLDWLSPASAVSICRHCRAAGLRLALAGSLGPQQIVLLKEAAPDWFALRAAVCDHGQRDAAVATRRVHALVKLLAQVYSSSSSENCATSRSRLA